MPEISSANNQEYASHFFSLATRYCQHLQERECDTVEWLKSIFDILQQLQEAIELIPPVSCQFDCVDDTAQRFELFADLKQWLGDVDSYWLAGDKSVDTPSLTGSLADDFTDIYFEISNALERADEFSGDTTLLASALRGSYELHWAEHVRDALRYLSVLKVCQRI